MNIITHPDTFVISNSTIVKDTTTMIQFMRIATIALGLILISYIGKIAYEYKVEKVKTSQIYSNSGVTADVRMKQLDCLATNIYYEARSESFEGKAAVAQVTLNRAESNKFPNDICKVVYQKNVVYDKILCQFSWYCEGKPSIQIKNNEAYAQSMDAAKRVLLEGFRLPSLSTAIYYHAEYVNPKWNKQEVARIGSHIFYSDKPAGSSTPVIASNNTVTIQQDDTQTKKGKTK